MATGESIPAESRETTRPDEPTASPPGPRSRRAATYAAPCTTSTHTVRSGPESWTVLPSASTRCWPIAMFISPEEVEKSVEERRASTAKLRTAASPRRAISSRIATSAARRISPRSRRTTKQSLTCTTPGTADTAARTSSARAGSLMGTRRRDEMTTAL